MMYEFRTISIFVLSMITYFPNDAEGNLDWRWRSLYTGNNYNLYNNNQQYPVNRNSGGATVRSQNQFQQPFTQNTVARRPNWQHGGHVIGNNIHQKNHHTNQNIRARVANIKTKIRIQNNGPKTNVQRVVKSRTTQLRRRGGHSGVITTQQGNTKLQTRHAAFKHGVNRIIDNNHKGKIATSGVADIGSFAKDISQQIKGLGSHYHNSQQGSNFLELFVAGKHVLSKSLDLQPNGSYANAGLPWYQNNTSFPLRSSPHTIKQTIIFAKTANVLSSIDSQNNDKVTHHTNNNGTIQNIKNKINITKMNKTSSFAAKTGTGSRNSNRQHNVSRELNNRNLLAGATNFHQGSNSPNLNRNINTASKNSTKVLHPKGQLPVTKQIENMMYISNVKGKNGKKTTRTQSSNQMNLLLKVQNNKSILPPNLAEFAFTKDNNKTVTHKSSQLKVLPNDKSHLLHNSTLTTSQRIHHHNTSLTTSHKKHHHNTSKALQQNVASKIETPITDTSATSSVRQISNKKPTQLKPKRFNNGIPSKHINIKAILKAPSENPLSTPNIVKAQQTDESKRHNQRGNILPILETPSPKANIRARKMLISDQPVAAINSTSEHQFSFPVFEPKTPKNVQRQHRHLNVLNSSSQINTTSSARNNSRTNSIQNESRLQGRKDINKQDENLSRILYSTNGTNVIINRIVNNNGAFSILENSNKHPSILHSKHPSTNSANRQTSLHDIQTLPKSRNKNVPRHPQRNGIPQTAIPKSQNTIFSKTLDRNFNRSQNVQRFVNPQGISNNIDHRTSNIGRNVTLDPANAHVNPLPGIHKNRGKQTYVQNVQTKPLKIPSMKPLMTVPSKDRPRNVQRKPVNVGQSDTRRWHTNQNIKTIVRQGEIGQSGNNKIENIYPPTTSLDLTRQLSSRFRQTANDHTKVRQNDIQSNIFNTKRNPLTSDQLDRPSNSVLVGTSDIRVRKKLQRGFTNFIEPSTGYPFRNITIVDISNASLIPSRTNSIAGSVNQERKTLRQNRKPTASTRNSNQASHIAVSGDRQFGNIPIDTTNTRQHIGVQNQHVSISEKKRINIGGLGQSQNHRVDSLSGDKLRGSNVTTRKGQTSGIRKEENKTAQVIIAQRNVIRNFEKNNRNSENFKTNHTKKNAKHQNINSPPIFENKTANSFKQPSNINMLGFAKHNESKNKGLPSLRPESRNMHTMALDLFANTNPISQQRTNSHSSQGLTNNITMQKSKDTNVLMKQSRNLINEGRWVINAAWNPYFQSATSIHTRTNSVLRRPPKGPSKNGSQRLSQSIMHRHTGPVSFDSSKQKTSTDISSTATQHSHYKASVKDFSNAAKTPTMYHGSGREGKRIFRHSENVTPKLVVNTPRVLSDSVRQGDIKHSSNVTSKLAIKTPRDFNGSNQHGFLGHLANVISQVPVKSSRISSDSGHQAEKKDTIKEVVLKTTPITHTTSSNHLPSYHTRFQMENVREKNPLYNPGKQNQNVPRFSSLGNIIMAKDRQSFPHNMIGSTTTTETGDVNKNSRQAMNKHALQRYRNVQRSRFNNVGHTHQSSNISRSSLTGSIPPTRLHSRSQITNVNDGWSLNAFQRQDPKVTATAQYSSAVLNRTGFNNHKLQQNHQFINNHNLTSGIERKLTQNAQMSNKQVIQNPVRNRGTFGIFNNNNASNVNHWAFRQRNRHRNQQARAIRNRGPHPRRSQINRNQIQASNIRRFFTRLQQNRDFEIDDILEGFELK